MGKSPRRLALPTWLLATLAMFAFAGNSLLCRLALQQALIDPATFGSIRLVSGAVTLAFIVRLRSAASMPASADWLAAAMLFVYVVFFSFAYVILAAGTGALILFGAVQFTMFGVGLRSGERMTLRGWTGLGLAIGGIAYLVWPGVSAPSFFGAASMASAGVAWGVYSLRGRGIADPLGATSSNFIRAVPFALALNLGLVSQVHADAGGVALAIASGAVTSGIGYVIWYAALRELPALRAATIQLSVPPIAAFGGVALLAEPLTPRLVAASFAILGGIFLALSGRVGLAKGPSSVPQSLR